VADVYSYSKPAKHLPLPALIMCRSDDRSSFAPCSPDGLLLLAACAAKNFRAVNA
jgi:hypothetical protein